MLFLAALAGSPRRPCAEDTLFTDMGGQPGIDKLVDASVDNYLADHRIKAIFDESNMDRVRAGIQRSSSARSRADLASITAMTWLPRIRACI